MSQVTTPSDATTRHGRADHRLVHLAPRLALPLPGPGSPFAPRVTEPRRRTLALVSALADRGVVQTVVTDTGRGRSRGTLPAGVPVRAVRTGRGLPLLPTVRAVRAATTTAGSLHVHVDGHGPLAAVLAAASASPAPVVVHLAGSLSSPVRTGGRSRLLDRVVESQLEAALLRLATLVVAPNAGLAEVAAAAGAPRVAVLPPAVLHADDLERPTTAPPPPVDPGPPLPHLTGPRLLAVGALSRRWDRTGMLAALVARPRTHLVVVGGGSGRDGFEAAVRSAGVADRVHVHPRVSWRDVERHVDAADVVLHTPYAGEDPAALLLARAAGRPVVASAVEGVEALVSHDVDGLLVPPTGAEACAAAVAALLDDPRRAAQLGAAAARRSRARSWDDVAGRLLDGVRLVGA